MKLFSTLHPALLMTYFMSVILIAMFSSDPITGACALFGGGLFCCTLFPMKKNLKNAGFDLLIIALLAVCNPLFSHNGVTVLFYLNDKAVTAESILYGAGAGLTLCAVLRWFAAFSEIMTSDRLLYLFGKTAPKLSLALSMSLRFVPLYLRQAKKVAETQKALGMFSGQSRTERIRSRVSVLSSVIRWALENAMETALSMNARGYGAKKRRTSCALFRFGPVDAAVASAAIPLLLFLIIGISFRPAAFAYYPEITPIPVTPLSVSLYAAYLLLCLLPFITEISEKTLWICYESKM